MALDVLAKGRAGRAKRRKNSTNTRGTATTDRGTIRAEYPWFRPESLRPLCPLCLKPLLVRRRFATADQVPGQTATGTQQGRTGRLTSAARHRIVATRSIASSIRPQPLDCCCVSGLSGWIRGGSDGAFVYAAGVILVRRCRVLSLRQGHPGT